MSTRAAPRDVGDSNQAKRRRTVGVQGIEVGGPVEDEATARRKLEEAGFDPDKLSEAKMTSMSHIDPATPMLYFCFHGDLPMCRYLFVHGAAKDVTTCPPDEEGGTGFYCPMCAAARQGHLGVCQWLFDHGAAEDIRRRNSEGYTPLSVACLNTRKNRENMWRFLVLNGALGCDTSGRIDAGILRHNLGLTTFDSLGLQIWAQDAVQTHATFRNVFLMGTFAPPEFSVPSLFRLFSRKLGSESVASMLLEGMPNDRCQRIWAELAAPKCPLHCFSGLPGIMELIADFVGVPHGRNLRTLRELAEQLELWREEEAAKSSSSESSSSSDDDDSDNDDESHGVY